MATNCRVIVAFEEILRSESRKQVIQALSNGFQMVPSLPKIVVYDAGCVLVKYLRSKYEDPSSDNDMLRTSGVQTLYNEVRFFVDRFHLKNHTQVIKKTLRELSSFF